MSQTSFKKPTDGGPLRMPSWGCLFSGLGIAAFLSFIYFIALPTVLRQTTSLTLRNHATENARLIHRALQAYAADHNGHYPDTAHPSPTSANQAFRTLIQQGYSGSEQDFGWMHHSRAPQSGDMQMGESPSYAQALQPGECHWALVCGLTTTSPPNEVLVMEDPAEASWPPRWSIYHGYGDEAPQFSLPPGSVWHLPQVLLLRNDGSVTPALIAEGQGPQPVIPWPRKASDPSPPPPPAFDPAHPRRILDVED